jgi:hypothetical protein
MGNRGAAGIVWGRDGRKGNCAEAAEEAKKAEIPIGTGHFLQFDCTIRQKVKTETCYHHRKVICLTVIFVYFGRVSANFHKRGENNGTKSKKRGP